MISKVQISFISPVPRTAVFPVLVEEGVTSLSTVTQLFTLDIQPSPTLGVSLSAKASTLPGFVDIDANFESGVITRLKR